MTWDAYDYYYVCPTCGEYNYSPDGYCSEHCKTSVMTEEQKKQYYEWKERQKEIERREEEARRERERMILEAKKQKYSDIVTADFKITAEQLKKKISFYDGDIIAQKQITHNGYSFMVEQILYFTETTHLQDKYDMMANIVTDVFGYDNLDEKVRVYFNIEIDRDILFKSYDDPHYFADLINNGFGEKWVFNANFAETKRKKSYANISITIEGGETN